MNNLGNIVHVLSMLFDADQVIELRIPKTSRKTVSGYFNDPVKLAEAVMQWNGKAPGIYLTINPVKPDLLARSANHLREYAEQTTSDNDILKRQWLPLDFDPVRSAGISSTREEHEAALGRAKEVRACRHGLGWPEIIFADSGNGAHLLYRIDLPNTPENTSLIQRCLIALALQFDDGIVSVDLTTYNPARIWKLYGTMACKGDSTAERPHRQSRLLDVPNKIEVVGRDLLEHLASMVPDEPKPERSSFKGNGFDLDQWIEQSGLVIVRTGSWNGGRKWILNPCPWNDEHTNQAAYIIQQSNGAIAAGCHHNGCAGKGWHDLRDIVEPGWRERRKGTETDPKDNPWSRAKDAPSFLAEQDQEIDYLEDKVLKPGSITELFSPKGIGKTHIAHAYAVRLAKAEKRVLLIDRDNPKREVRRRLKAWGASEAENLKILGRDDAPPLTDTKTWSSFPYKDYDLVIIDSLDASTEGTGEQDSAKPSRAIAPLLDIAHRDEGPAVLVLGNTVKSGAHYRGSGVIGDRADIVYEVRDATDLKPSGKKPWWEELPPSGEGDWAARATRRKKRTSYRLAFIPSKFRVGEEPDPFCLEICLPEDQLWDLRDVTVDIIKSGEDTIAQAKKVKEEQLDKAAQALVEVITERVRGDKPILKTDGGNYLREEANITREDARQLIEDKANVFWKIVPLPGKGKPLGLVPLDWEPPKNDPAAKMQGSGEADQKPLSETPISADQAQSGRQKYPARNALPEAEMQGGLFSPPRDSNRSTDTTRDVLTPWGRLSQLSEEDRRRWEHTQGIQKRADWEQNL